MLSLFLNLIHFFPINAIKSNCLPWMRTLPLSYQNRLTVWMATEKTYPYFILVVLFLAGFPAIHAQVYPGDANNDGIVSNLDILYIGYAYGAIGPIRPSAGTDFSEEAIVLPWSAQFPNPDSTNYAFADADGSGQIDFQDFLIVAL